jgi:hypothetical protein
MKLMMRMRKFSKILQAKDTQSSTICAATKGIQTTFFVQSKLEQKPDSLCSFFVCNPRPVACVEPKDSDNNVEMVQVPIQGAST